MVTTWTKHSDDIFECNKKAHRWYNNDGLSQFEKYLLGVVLKPIMSFRRFRYHGSRRKRRNDRC